MNTLRQSGSLSLDTRWARFFGMIYHGRSIALALLIRKTIWLLEVLGKGIGLLFHGCAFLIGKLQHLPQRACILFICLTEIQWISWRRSVFRTTDWFRSIMWKTAMKPLSPRDLYMQVQEEMVRRANLHSGQNRKKRVYSSKYALLRLFCFGAWMMIMLVGILIFVILCLRLHLIAESRQTVSIMS